MHCPQCGEPTPERAAVCPFCGHRLAAPEAAPGIPMARTMVGMPRGMLVQPGGASEPNKGVRTVVGVGAPVNAPNPQDPATSPADQLVQTRVGHRPPTANKSERPPAPAPPPSAPPASAPPSSARAPDSVRDSKGRAHLMELRRGDEPRRQNGHRSPDELGATIAPREPAVNKLAKRLEVNAQNSPRIFIPPLKPPKIQKPKKVVPTKRDRAVTTLLVVAGVITVGAIAFAVLWSGRTRITARVRTDAQSREVIEISCSRCPDGTVISSGQASSTVSATRATFAPEKPLMPGENRLKVRVDRPGDGRDETITIATYVAYRIRPDLSALQAEKPAIQVVIEAAKGTQISLDGRPVSLYAGRATESFDVTDACMGLASEATMLNRQIPYVATTPDGEEKGSVNVAVGVVPLEIDAPGPNVVIDGPSFVLAGRTLKGAELIAAGRPIPVKPDGSFAHIMNVSSVGSTQIEVRSKFAGMAPRITKIRVRRVDNLETAAKEFAAENPVSLSGIAKNISSNAGKAIVVSGRVLDVQRDGRRTVMLLDVAPPSGCAGCTARLVQGAESAAQVSDTITAYGHVIRPVLLPDRGEIPEIQVDFTLKGQR